MKGFIETTQEKFYNQLNNFVLKIGNYPELDLPQTTIDALTLDNQYLGWVISCKKVWSDYGHAWTNYASLLYHAPAGTLLGQAPQLPTLPKAPQSVDANIYGRFSNAAATCKKSPQYTSTKGTDLGIETMSATFDPQAGKPVAKISMQAGHPFIQYTRGQYWGVQIYKDSGAGYQKLDKVHHTEFLDTSPLPAVGSSAVWKYKLIFIWHDAEAGTMSDEVSMSVMGV